MNIRPYQMDDRNAVLDLWERCQIITPAERTFADADLTRKLQMQPELFVIGELDSSPIATAMAGYDGHRGHLYYLAVCPAHQHLGHGREMVAHVQNLLRQRGCHRLTLYVSNDNLKVEGFYQRLGFSRNEVVSMGISLSPSASSTL